MAKLSTLASILGLAGGTLALADHVLSDLETSGPELGKAMDSVADEKIQTTYYEINQNDIEARLKILCNLANKFVHHDSVTRVASILGKAAAKRYGERSDYGQAVFIFTFLKHAIVYVRDANIGEKPVDTFHSPPRVLQLRRGDCDDFTILAMALAQNMGLNVQEKVVRTEGHGSWNHIYPMIGVRQRNGTTKFVAVDATVKNKTKPGYESSNIVDWITFNADGQVVQRKR